MEDPTDIVDAFEVIDAQKAKILDLEARLRLIEQQWDDIYEENLHLHAVIKHGAT